MGKQRVLAPAGREEVVGHIADALNLLRNQQESCDHQEIDWSIPARKQGEGDAQFVARVLRRRTWKNKEYVGVPIICMDCNATGTEWYQWEEDEWGE
jgi:hypothetical protein